MQENASFPHWLQLCLTALASLLGGVGIDKLYASWLTRKNPAAEIHLTDANTQEVTVRSAATAGDAVMRMLDRLDKTQIEIDRLRNERDEWRVKALKADDDAKAADMFVHQLEAAGKLIVCEHHPQGVRLRDFTPQQLNPKDEAES